MSNNKIQYDMAWGNPYFLLEALDEFYATSSFSMGGTVQDMIYGPYEGLPAMIQETHKVIKQIADKQYKHILITNGASNAINTILRHFKSQGGESVYTTQYGYPSYEQMIKRAGLNRIRDLEAVPFSLDEKIQKKNIRLIDSPENPFGDQYAGGNPGSDIWDAVYHNKIYTYNLFITPYHRIHVGSYSKLLGVAGARVGFIATDDTLLYEALVQESRNDLTGPSKPSQRFILDILKKIDLDQFMLRGRQDLCYNKEEFQKIEYLFDGQKVNDVGMFYCAMADQKALNLLDRVGVGYVKLDEETNTIRISMGQTKKLTKDAIKAILKGDGK